LNRWTLLLTKSSRSLIVYPRVRQSVVPMRLLPNFILTCVLYRVEHLWSLWLLVLPHIFPALFSDILQLVILKLLEHPNYFSYFDAWNETIKDEIFAREPSENHITFILSMMDCLLLFTQYSCPSDLHNGSS